MGTVNQDRKVEKENWGVLVLPDEHWQSLFRDAKGPGHRILWVAILSVNTEASLLRPRWKKAPSGQPHRDRRAVGSQGHP